MTAEQLEELLGKVTQGEWRVDKWGETVESDAGQVIPNWFDSWECSDRFVPECHRKPNTDLIALAPSLAHRVLAAEKLVREVRHYTYGNAPLHSLRSALTAYREASK